MSNPGGRGKRGRNGPGNNTGNGFHHGRGRGQPSNSSRGRGDSRGNHGEQQPFSANPTEFPDLLNAFFQLGDNGGRGQQSRGGHMPTNSHAGQNRGLGRGTGEGQRRGQGRNRGHDRSDGRDWRNSRGQAGVNVQSEEQGEGSSGEDEVRVVEKRPAKRERKFEGPVFGFKRLYNFLTSSPDEVLISISKDKEDWKALLENDDLTGEKLIVALEVLGEKVCADIPVLLQQQSNILSACCSKPFVKKLEDAVPKIAMGTFLPSRRKPNTEFPVDCDPKKVLSNVRQFCSVTLKIMPDTALDYLGTLISVSFGASIQCDPTMELFQTFKGLNEQVHEIVEREKKKVETVQRQRRNGFNEDDEAEFDEETPPNQIQDIEIIPTINELRCKSDSVFLRPNKQTGSYKDSSHYLDVQFRLLREDFVQPLRKGINIFLKDRQLYLSGAKKMPLGEVRLYTKVSFLKVEKERDTIVHKLQMNMDKRLKKIKWDKSKRLLPGSLIVFTSEENCFQQHNTHFGVVFNRNSKELENGILTIIWEGSPPVYDEDEEYFILESEVYLEAYRHTLETLKNLELDNFPMKKFIVDANSCVEAPNYLKTATKMLEVKLASGEDRYIAPLQLQWPTAEEFGLDNNQLDAFKAALTKEFTIIQGPPGTGKTFLGLKVAEVLLKNSALWEDPEGNPITVVCYTNHALDQFLEGILRFYQREEIPAEIIRIGGRCKSEVLAKYSLREVRYRNRRKIPQSYYAAERIHREEIEELEAKRNNSMSEVTGLQDVQGVVDFEKISTWAVIQPEYPRVLWNCFQNLKWLGIHNDQLNKGQFSADQIVRGWFTIRQFAKNQKKAKNFAKMQQEQVERNNLDEDDEDDEDYDVDELLDNRILDDIYLEAESTTRANVGRHLAYLPECSIHTCDKRMKTINRNLQESTKGLNMAETTQVREATRGELRALENRKNLLIEICRLYKEQLLDLPDVTDLLKDIRGSVSAVHYDRLKMAERWALYFAIVEATRRKVAESVADIEKELVKAQRALRNLIQFGDGQVLRGCKVVGLTTTGAAKYNNLLRMIKSKIVIVEEAAEVFESHIVTCITQSCEQLILIGDHRQLRPSPTVYDLAVKYRLDLSLFERMLNNKLHCYPLKMQHRMRPDIADLVVGSIYEELLNHDSVKTYPDVMGVTKNVFFITHNEQESSDSDSMSKSNQYEAQFLAGLCRYLIQQGYNADEITVLTMYTGQMFLLKKEIGVIHTCKGVRITCVDNFQGEENKIILLSLVRSNDQGKIGFLGIDNRICVSLSRAKHGLFVIGNMNAMVKNKTWNIIKEKLVVQEGIGTELELECQNHGIRTKVKRGEDFLTKTPQGGCLQLCDTILACSHKCGQVCHVRDKEHQEYKCKEPCLKQCANSLHPCKGKCSDQCPPCNIQIEKTLDCELQHKKRLPCHKKVEGILCFEQVNKRLPCNHEEILACHISIHSFVCKIKVEKVLPCGHKKTMECHADPTAIRCKEIVEKVLPCDHKQDAECWVQEESIKCETMVPRKFPKCTHEIMIKCSERTKPITCKGHCTTRLPCGHACVKVCHVDEDPEHLTYQCKKTCSRDCQDGHKCVTGHQCFKQPCPPCKERVVRDLPCGHRKELECYIDINQYECLETCERILPNPLCRHKCQNLCYQPCGPCHVMVKKHANCGHGQTVMCSEPAVKENCEEMVRPKNTPVCGHRDATVFCKYDDLPAEEVVKFCQHPCGHIFNPAAGGGCGHKCMGTCSSCLQGRIHMKCSSPCGKQLVCGHVCEVNCSAVCPPCKKPCLMKCEHSECTQKCGMPCSECKEKCTWNCPHKACTKLCGEQCDREPCNEPCSKKLKCGHDCVGFCGEPCPPLCRICDHEELTAFFLLGNEEDEDARFVYLEDCRHTIEVEGLEGWLLTSGDGLISAKRCPRCKTAIRNCRRFGNVIRQHYQDIVKVKMRAFGNKANSETMRNKWISNLNNNPPMERLFQKVHMRIRNILIQEVHRQVGHHTATTLIPKTIDEFSMRSLDFIADCTHKIAGVIDELKRNEQLKSPHYDKVLSIYRKTLESMLDRQPLSRQEIMDFNEELDRLDYYLQLMRRRCIDACNPTNGRAYPTYVKAKKIVTSTRPFTAVRKELFKATLKELDDLLKSGLGITDRERKEILQAMGMGQGHWYKCPNGHVYVIGECGGAMEQSKCNECGAQIGGGSHRLVAGNTLAGEMDGAQQPAWPTALAQ